MLSVLCKKLTKSVLFTFDGAIDLSYDTLNGVQSVTPMQFSIQQPLVQKHLLLIDERYSISESK